MDYTDLLKIYLKSEPNPNLFNLIILNLLKDFIPVSTGSPLSLEKQYNFLVKNLISDAWTRNSRCHKLGLGKIPDFDINLRLILDAIFELVNKFLTKYFSLTDLIIEYDLKPIRFIYPNGNKSSWYLDTDLRLSIKKNNINLGSDYKDYLNEARLSSISICIYLASLRLFPNKIDYKLIYLDDIFIGIDTSNRIPIINILNNEFNDYQIIISTYDKNFFEVCRYKLVNNLSSKLWNSIEIYVGEISVAGDVIDIPIILSNSTDLDKARYYLYNNEKPDYPASANYFRKYLENKLKEIFPIEIYRNNELEEIDSYKLSKMFNLCNDFLNSLNINIKELKELNSYLFILLHPLSHYNHSIHTYKRDLKEIDKIITFLFEKTNTLSFLKDIFFCCNKTTLRFEFHINQYNIWYYEFYIDKPLYYSLSNKSFSNSNIVCTSYYSILNNKIQPVKKLNRKTSKIKYNSLHQANEEISKHILHKYRFFIKKNDIFEYAKIFDGTNWVNFKNYK